MLNLFLALKYITSNIEFQNTPSNDELKSNEDIKSDAYLENLKIDES